MASYMKNINIISRCCSLWRFVKLKDFDIGDCQHSYIYEICRNPGVSQDQLARRLFVNKSNASRQLAWLEKSGFVERRQSEKDRRVIHVYPTEKMLKLLPEVRAASLQWREYLTKGMTDEEIKTLSELLERMASRAAGYAERALPEDVGE
jgi:MarR family transcriptional regulator for hemolysin